MRYPWISLVVLLLTCTATEAIELTMHGSLKNESAYFIAGVRQWDKIQNRLELKPEAVLGGGWQFRSRALLWYDAAMDIEATRAPDLTASIKRHYRTASQIKEAYLLYEGNSFDLRLGQQQIVWGKTDGLRMLDIINPIDMREFILDDFLDSRIGLVAARLNYYPDTDTEQEFELLFTPNARPSKTAPTGSRWALTTPPIPTGITLQQVAAQQPNWSANNSEAGAAWRGNNIRGWDLSLNYFYGWKDSPNAFRQIRSGLMQLQLRHLRMHTIGGSFSNAFAAWVVRGEVAANLSEGINSNGSTWRTTVQRKNTLNAALALEWSRYNWSVSPQFFIRQIRGWSPTLMEPKTSGFWTLRIATDFLHEKLKPEILLLSDWATGGWLARYKTTYAWSDQLTLTLGADIFGGNRGLIGQFANNDRIYSEAEYAF
ncbi:MAG: DUF1302 family protein [Mariprofundales bacterium]